jgi:hypothetical protein
VKVSIVIHIVSIFDGPLGVITTQEAAIYQSACRRVAATASAMEKEETDKIRQEGSRRDPYLTYLVL